MRPKKQLPKATISKLEAFLKQPLKAGEHKRAQCIYLRAKFDMDAASIAKVVGWSVQGVYDIQSAFMREGMSVLRHKPKGGRYHCRLSLSQEKKLLAGLEQASQRGSVLEVGEVHRQHCHLAGKPLAASTTYRMLSRHGWRKVAPRPRHPNHSRKKAEAFKKTSPPGCPSPPRCWQKAA